MRNRRRSSPERQRELVTTQADLTALTKHPAWPTLIAVIENEREKLRRLALTEALGGVAPVDERKLQRYRGFIKGMTYIVAVCEGAEARLEQALRDGIKQEEAS